MRKAIAAVAVALMATCLWAQDKPLSVFGYTEGQALPDREPDVDVSGHLTYLMPGKAGFDVVKILGTHKTGICKVIGHKDVPNPRDDSFGLRHKAQATILVERVTAKLGAEPSGKFDIVVTGFAERNPDLWPISMSRGDIQWFVYWEEDAAKGYSAVAVELSLGNAKASFEFNCHEDAVEERKANEAAEF